MVMDAKQYEKYVKEKTPTHNLFLNMLGAFRIEGMVVVRFVIEDVGMDLGKDWRI